MAVTHSGGQPLNGKENNKKEERKKEDRLIDNDNEWKLSVKRKEKILLWSNQGHASNNFFNVKL